MQILSCGCLYRQACTSHWVWLIRYMYNSTACFLQCNWSALFTINVSMFHPARSYYKPSIYFINLFPQHPPPPSLGGTRIYCPRCMWILCACPCIVCIWYYLLIWAYQIKNRSHSVNCNLQLCHKCVRFCSYCNLLEKPNAVVKGTVTLLRSQLQRCCELWSFGDRM